MGWIEEVGAGAKTFKDYCPLFYAGSMPEIEDSVTFRCILKRGNGNQGSNQGNGAGNQGNQPLNEKQLEVLKFFITPRSAAEIFSHLQISKQTKNRTEILFVSLMQFLKNSYLQP